MLTVEIYKDRKNQFRFRVKAHNKKIIAQSEGYTTKAACKKGIRSLFVGFGGLNGYNLIDLTKKKKVS